MKIYYVKKLDKTLTASNVPFSEKVVDSEGEGKEVLCKSMKITSNEAKKVFRTKYALSLKKEKLEFTEVVIEPTKEEKARNELREKVKSGKFTEADIIPALKLIL